MDKHADFVCDLCDTTLATTYTLHDLTVEPVDVCCSCFRGLTSGEQLDFRPLVHSQWQQLSWTSLDLTHFALTDPGPTRAQLFGGKLFEWSGTVEAGGKIRLALTCLFPSTRTASLTLRGLNTVSFSRCHRALRAVEQLGKHTLIGARGETGGWQERSSCRQTSCLLSKGSGRSPLLRPAQTLAALQQQPASASSCAGITKATWKHARPAARRCSPPAFGRGRCCPGWCVSPANLRSANPTQPRSGRSCAGSDLEYVPESPGILRVPLRRHQETGPI